MKTQQIAAIVLAGAATLAVGNNPASAFSFSVGGTVAGENGYKSSVTGARTIDFNNGSAGDNFVNYSGINGNIVQGSVSGQHAAPAGDTTKFMTISNKGSGVAGATGSVNLNFGKAIDYFGLYWGSVDRHNFIDFYFGDKLVKTFGGGDISSTATGSWTGASDNLFLNFFADQGEMFDKIVLRGEGTAFESDNHTYRVAGSAEAVPEPLTIGGSLVGLALGWRAKKRMNAKNA